MTVVRNIPNAFEIAVNKVKDEMQNSKRTQPKSEDESDKNSRMKNLLIQMKAATSGPGIPA